MENHVLTDEVKEYLQQIAERLPQIPVKVNKENVVIQLVQPKKGFRGKAKKVFIPKSTAGIPQYCMMLGAAMIDNNIKLANNEKIDPDKKYYLEVGVVMINHYKELEKAYIQEGSIGTSKYISKIQSS